MFGFTERQNNITKLNNKVKLTEEDLIQLCLGKQISINNTDIILEDIGYYKIIPILEKARNNLYFKK